MTLSGKHFFQHLPATGGSWYLSSEMRRAVIDIGTNTVKLLVAEVLRGEVVAVLSKDKTTRLGEGVDRSRRLLGAAIARTAQCVQQFVQEAKAAEAVEVVAFTTSAAREAENREAFTSAIRQSSGVDVQVISGDREAQLIFRGVCSDPAWSSLPVLVMDVGGGSAEFILGTRGEIKLRQSLSLGAVRLTEQFGDANFSGLCEYLRTTLYNALQSYRVDERKMIATGGTITTLARVQRGEVDHAIISQQELRALVAKLNAMSLEERMRVPGVPPERADIIVAGGALFMVAMEILGATELTVSIRNLRYGALLEGA